MKYKDGDLLRVIKCHRKSNLIGNTFKYDICVYGESDYLCSMNGIEIYQNDVEKVEFKSGVKVEVCEFCDQEYQSNHTYICWHDRRHITMNKEGEIKKWIYCRLDLNIYPITINGNQIKISKEDYKMLIEKYGDRK